MFQMHKVPIQYERNLQRLITVKFRLMIYMWWKYDYDDAMDPIIYKMMMGEYNFEHHN